MATGSGAPAFASSSASNIYQNASRSNSGTPIIQQRLPPDFHQQQQGSTPSGSLYGGSLTISGREVRLGTGSWANAYREAARNPDRKRALGLIFQTRIISTKEIEDDLTVITPDHIDECVEIALGMLAQYDERQWLNNSEATQAHFEQQLMKMYTRKFAGKV